MKLFSLISTVMLLFISCGENRQETAEPNVPDTVIFVMTSAPGGNFTPMHAQGDYDFYPIRIANESLIAMDKDQKYIPKLATSWDFSDQGKTLTFHLRKNVYWHDGEPFTSQDVRFSLEFMAHPDFASWRFNYLQDIVGANEFKTGKTDSISGIETPDDHTVIIRYSDPNPVALYKLYTFYMAPAHVWEGIAPAESGKMTEMLRNPIGTGPYKFVEFVPDQYVRFEANPDYWDGKPKIPYFVFQVMNENTAQAQLLQHKIHFLRSSDWSEETMNAYAESDVIPEDVYYFSTRYIGLNMKKIQIFQDKRVRQAFQYIVDQQELVDNVLYGHGEPTYSAVLSDSWAFPEGLNDYSYNPEKAIELLQEVGWEYRNDVMYRNGEPVKFTLKTGGVGNKVYDLMLPVLQQYFQRVGIELEVLPMEFATALDQVKKGDYEMYLMGTHLGMDPSYTENLYSTDSPSNLTGYSNLELDALYQDGLKYMTIEERSPIYEKIAHLTNEDLPMLYLFRWGEAYARAGNLKGTDVSNATSAVHNVHKWYFE